MNTILIKSKFDQKDHSVFYDFSIDGTSLFDLFDMHGTNRIDSLSWRIDNAYKRSLVKQFLNEEKNSELDSERIMLFVCSECGDIGCGGTTFKLIETDTEIIWTEFGDEDWDGVDLSEYKHIGSFTFEKVEYKKVFNEYLNTLK